MESVHNNYLGKHKKFRIDSKKLAAVFAISAFLVAIIVFWWLKLVGITVTGEAFCGLDEHTHSEDCYISELVCGFDETVTGTLPTQEEPSQTEASTEETSEAQSEGDEAEESAKSSEKEKDNVNNRN